MDTVQSPALLRTQPSWHNCLYASCLFHAPKVTEVLLEAGAAMAPGQAVSLSCSTFLCWDDFQYVVVTAVVSAVLKAVFESVMVAGDKHC